jgi:hypothetical protein
MNDKLLKRIIRKTEVPDIIDVLVDRISLAELQSLLLEVYRRKVSKIDSSSVLKTYHTNRFVQPSPIDAHQAVTFDLLAYSILPQGYEVIELSPVSPLGACSRVAPVSQNNVLTTMRSIFYVMAALQTGRKSFYRTKKNGI